MKCILENLKEVLVTKMIKCAYNSKSTELDEGN